VEVARSDPLQPLLHGDPLRLSDARLAALAKGIGHAFARPELAAEALTHRSALDRQPALKAAFPNGNERLEFLGDRVLGLVVADLLYAAYPQEDEGALAKRLAVLARKDTLARVLPFWNDRIVPELLAGKNVLVVAHGNSLRAVVKMLDNVSEAEITELNIPTGVPLVYELDANLKPVKSGYLGDPEAIKAAAEAVKKQTEKKK
jgi:hypothetical protein